MTQKSPSQRGGARPGAGRKKGSSAYGESTRAIRIPESMIPKVKTLLARRKQHLGQLNAATSLPAEPLSSVSIPLFTGKVAAGFPSPADDYVEKTLDLNELLIQKPAATFFVRAEGESMLGAGIHPNDILVVDRSIEPAVGKIVICALNGELTVKRLKSLGRNMVLAAENPDYADIVVDEEVDLVVWGVVTNVIHKL
ncbi:LexA family protein [Methylomarinum roseum]|uniref:LexA family protein n=1 Tax=Methylomarinum roseum TaxID=3067653 RepID=UPI003D7F0CCB